MIKVRIDNEQIKIVTPSSEYSSYSTLNYRKNNINITLKRDIFVCEKEFYLDVYYDKKREVPILLIKTGKSCYKMPIANNYPVRYFGLRIEVSLLGKCQ